jgi:hypothetical protein
VGKFLPALDLDRARSSSPVRALVNVELGQYSFASFGSAAKRRSTHEDPGRLLVSILGAITEFERESILSRMDNARRRDTPPPDWFLYI